LLSQPCKVEYFEPKIGFAEMETLYPVFHPEQHVIYEDDDLIAVFKPAGLPSKPSKEQQKFSLLASLERYAGRRLHLPSRLDAATAGLIIASKTKRAHAPLQQSFERRQIHKHYLLETEGRVDWKRRTVNAAIDRDPRHPVLRRTVADGGKKAVTRFVLLCASTFTSDGREHSAAVLLAEPLTGRTHQIRVHSASLGLPIIGDAFYGGIPDKDLHLLSYRLQMPHPLTGRPLSIELPPALLPEWARPGKKAFDNQTVANRKSDLSPS